MILMVTKDRFLFEGVSHLVKQEQIIKIEKLAEINDYFTDASSKLIIDAYHNNVLDDHAISILQSLEVGSIFLLAPFHISKIKTRLPISFVNRKMEITDWLSLFIDNPTLYRKPKIGFSHNQYKIVTHFLNQQNPDDIAANLNISRQTLRSQKFNIMLKLKLRRMSDIVTLNIFPYF
ncbi:LuxR family transcriptional regulator [Kosakonia sp. BYX6]|uniref:LuxR family transcriptional regulator n=1 Tax=Kosakonia calanthes TaxID=3139408 RepID=A0ABZ3B2R5_9ENTR